MKINADREVCVGAGMCALTAPELFDQDESDGRVTLLRDEPDPEQAEPAREAVDLCPAGALSLEDG